MPTEEAILQWQGKPLKPKPKHPRRIITICALISTFLIAFVIFARYTSGVQDHLAKIAEAGHAEPEHGEPEHDAAMPMLEHPEPEHEDHEDVMEEPPHFSRIPDSSRLHPEDHVLRPADTINQFWRISKGEKRPDGVLKHVYLINGGFPGPTIEARSGDRLLIQVENALGDDEAVTLHWHGLSMRGANSMDGAAGITQTPIKAGEVFTYDFVLDDDQSGTFWYHAHDGVQRGDGLYGGLVIHKPLSSHKRHGGHEEEEEPEFDDEHILLISDWYHRSAKDALEAYMHPGAFGMETVPDSVLLNGQGAYTCSNAAPAQPVDCAQRDPMNLPVLVVDSYKRSVLRVVNVGAYAGFNITASGSALTPLGVDGSHPIKGASALNVGVLHPGERMDLAIDPFALGSAMRHALTVTLDTTPFKYQNMALNPSQDFFILVVEANGKQGDVLSPAVESFDIQAATSAHDQSSVLPRRADRTIVLYAITEKLAHLENEPHGFINQTTWVQPSSTKPLSALPPTDWDTKNQFVSEIYYDETLPLWIDVVLNNLDEEGHPFHLHGYDFWVLSTYTSDFNWGSYNPFEDATAPGGEYDLTRAVKKDTVFVPRRGYAVLRFRADNPGLWMFHCHVLWHLASGMAMTFDVR